MELIPLRIRVPFADEDEFVARWGVHVGRDGFFIATRTPKQEGTGLAFELVLSNGRTFFRGEGVVARRRAGMATGMAVRFLRLETPTQTLVDRIVALRGRREERPVGGGAASEPFAPQPERAPEVPGTSERPVRGGAAETPAESSPDFSTTGSVEPSRSEGSEPPPGSSLEPSEHRPFRFGGAETPAKASSESSVTRRIDASPSERTELPEPASLQSSEPEPVRATVPVESPRDERTEAPGASPESSEHGPFRFAGAGTPAEPSPEFSASASADSSRAERAEPQPSATPESSATGPVESSRSEGRGSPAGASSESSEHRPFRFGGAETPAEPSSESSASAPIESARSERTEPPPSTSLESSPAARDRAPGAKDSSRFGGSETPSASAESPPPQGEPPETAPSPPGSGPAETSTDRGASLRERLEIALRAAEHRERAAAAARTSGADAPEPAPSGPASDLAITPSAGVPSVELWESQMGAIPLTATTDDVFAEIRAEGTNAPAAIPLPAPSPVHEAARLTDAIAGAAMVPSGAAGELAVSAGAALETAATERVELPGPPVLPRVPASIPPERAPAPEDLEPVPPRPAAEMVLGIDLGAEFVRVVWGAGEQVEPLPADAAGTLDWPCRTVRTEGLLRVLGPAEPETGEVVGSGLALLGLRADSPAVRTLSRRWALEPAADERGEAAFRWEDTTISAVDLVTAMFRAVRARAEHHTGRTCSGAVVTVPAAFTATQRARVRETAEHAGFTVLRLLNASTAAALGFAYGRGLARKRLLVWRMGAATFDVAVVAATGNDLEVISSGGDASLGGANFDEQLALGLDKQVRTDAVRLRHRLSQAEHAKRALVHAESVEVSIEPGAPAVQLTRGDLEARTGALVERSLLLTREVLKAGGLAPENLDELVLAGGMALLPHVRSGVETALGRPARGDVDPLRLSALGAARLALALTGATTPRTRSSVAEVLAVAIDAVAPELGNTRALERGTRLPAEKTLTLAVPAGQPLEVQLFQGAARAPDPRSFLGLLRAESERPGDWTLQLSVNPDGVLNATATAPGGKRRALPLVAALGNEPAPAASPEKPAEEPRNRPGLFKRLFGRR